MANQYYEHDGVFPSPNSKTSSASMRAELDSIEKGFDKLPGLTGNADKVVFVKTDETGLVAATASEARTKLGLGTAATKQGTTGDLVGTTDTQTLTNKTLGNYTETVFAITDAASVALNPANGPIQTWILGASRTAADGFSTGQSITLLVAATTFAITWPTITWVGGTAPTLASAKATVLELWKVGTTLYGAKVGEA